MKILHHTHCSLKWERIKRVTISNFCSSSFSPLSFSKCFFLSATSSGQQEMGRRMPMKGLRMSSVEIPDTNDKSSASPSPCPSPVSILVAPCSCCSYVQNVVSVLMLCDMREERGCILRTKNGDRMLFHTFDRSNNTYFLAALCICMSESYILQALS